MEEEEIYLEKRSIWNRRIIKTSTKEELGTEEEKNRRNNKNSKKKRKNKRLKRGRKTGHD